MLIIYMKKFGIPACLIALLIATGCDTIRGRVSILVGDDSLRGYFSVDSDSVAMYASPEDKRSGKAECRVYEKEYDVFIKLFRILDDSVIRDVYRAKGGEPFSDEFAAMIRSIPEDRFRYRPGSSRPLAGLRIAVDPGHNAGSMEEAIRESKYMWIFDHDGRRLKFHESRLNLATALELKELLEKDGAEVMLTRSANRQVYPVPFDSWARRDFRRAVLEKQRHKFITDREAAILLTHANDKRRLKFFNSEYDMPYRAKLINAFRPDITVLVHYDAWGCYGGYREKYARVLDILRKNYGSRGAMMTDYNEVLKSTAVSDRNFSTVFVPGCFLGGELENMESRIEFLRLVISPDLKDSIRYSAYVMENFSKMLDLPPADMPLPGGKKVGFCQKGVYARNFRMTRLVHGPLCLGEPLQQNNLKEARDLARISEGKVPGRVRTVARAYYKAIRTYAARHIND
ncbi:MAG: N-acetylmuramoyl-L-alanine amidase [Spirochaetes bacterium]|nr:N-acetylmuramoyl-L-alanine amidase [Spirochaetota bacterium]